MLKVLLLSKEMFTVASVKAAVLKVEISKPAPHAKAKVKWFKT